MFGFLSTERLIGSTEEGVTGHRFNTGSVYDVARCGRGVGGGEDVAEANWPLDAFCGRILDALCGDGSNTKDRLTRLVSTHNAVHQASDSAAPKLLR